MPSLLDIGLGKVGGNSHPIHPATIHLPIAFLLAASFFDILSYMAVSFPSLFDAIVRLFASPYTSVSTVATIYHLSLFSYASTIAGIVTSFPALSSGAFEAYAMISSKGLDLSNPVIKTTLIHAGLNDLAVFGAVYNWLTRRGREDFMPWGGNALVSASILVLVGYAAFLGGSLVYTHGTAVQRMGKGKEEKENAAKDNQNRKKEL